MAATHAPAAGLHFAATHPPSPSAVEEKFTDTELEAAHNLVLLSESSSGGGEEGEGELIGTAMQRGRSHSSSSSSSIPSVNTRHLDPIAADTIDEEMTGPWARRQRYRSLTGIYEVTKEIGGAAGQKRKSSSTRRKRQE